MNKSLIIEAATEFVEKNTNNYISKEIALSPYTIGMKIFNPPIFAFGNPKDKMFVQLKEDQAIGPHFKEPTEWMVNAQTVISFFLPFSANINKSNTKTKAWPSDGWLHGRIEGQSLLDDLCKYLRVILLDAGYDSVIPSLDNRFLCNLGWGSSQGDHCVPYSSNWSERHVAYICGLGTFGLSKSLITKKGSSGRIASLITNLVLEHDMRSYSNLYQYCNMCGECIKRCPVSAITFENGKIHKPCGIFLEKTYAESSPWFGCGKCQTGVSCENSIPIK